MTRTFSAVIHWYVADCPEAGTVSQGKTVEEAIANFKEAAQPCLEVFPSQADKSAEVIKWSESKDSGFIHTAGSNDSLWEYGTLCKSRSNAKIAPIIL